MRNTKIFTLCSLSTQPWVADGVLPSRLEAYELAVVAQKSFRSWNSCWNAALAVAGRTEAEEDGKVVVILDGKSSGKVMALLSRVRILNESQDPTFDAEQGVHWETDKVNFEVEGNSVVIYSFKNWSDYQWDWIPGAETEIPLRLNMLERKAVANPDGFIGRNMSWCLEMQDIFWSIFARRSF